MPGTPLVWDETGKKTYELGNKKCALYKLNGTTYGDGIAWSGLTAFTVSNTGGDETALWADDIKYGSLRAAEECGGTIEAYQCPPEFYECDGCASLTTGVTVGQQNRTPFGLAVVTTVGNDTEGTGHGYKIHLIYGATASPSERSYTTINDSPDAITLSWEFSCTPVNVSGFKPTAHIEIDSTLVDATKLTAFEKILFGSTEANARLPLPDEVKRHFTTT